MIRIKIEGIDSDERYTFDSETIAGAIADCVQTLAPGESFFSIPSEMADLLETIAQAIRKHDNGEPAVAREWDFSSPESAYFVLFFEDASDDDGTPAEIVWRNASSANQESSECNTSRLTEGIIRDLFIATTRNEAGQHFTEFLSHDEELEELGLIKVNRPVHKATGIPYFCEHWTLEVTEYGMQILESNPDLRPN